MSNKLVRKWYPIIYELNPSLIRGLVPVAAVQHVLPALQRLLRGVAASVLYDIYGKCVYNYYLCFRC